MAPSGDSGGNEKPPPTDWGVTYTRLLDAGLRYDDIPRRTLPQIKAILGEWSEIRVNIPNIFGATATATSPPPPPDSGPPKVSQFAALAGMFGGIH